MDMPGKKCVAWICVYDPWDGSPLVQVHSDFVRFASLPDDGIQGFCKLFADGTRQIISGFDWYFSVLHPSGAIIISGNNDHPEENERRYPGCCLKRGKHTTDEWAHISAELLAIAHKDAQPCEGCG